jgi:hypothetical protein
MHPSIQDSFTRGFELHARVTLFGEGCRGSLTKSIDRKLGLWKDSMSGFQTYGASPLLLRMLPVARLRTKLTWQHTHTHTHDGQAWASRSCGRLTRRSTRPARSCIPSAGRWTSRPMAVRSCTIWRTTTWPWATWWVSTTPTPTSTRTASSRCSSLACSLARSLSLCLLRCVAHWFVMMTTFGRIRGGSTIRS